MILDDIVRAKKMEIRRAKEQTRPVDVRARAKDVAPARPFALRRPPEVSIISEIKRASPIKGVFREDLDPADLAGQYAKGGARALSVLTDSHFFKGSPDDLRAARAAVPLPVLRKDFVIEEYQLWETRAMGADAALLIVRILEPRQLEEYIAMAREDIGLATLVEVHSEKELEVALDARAEIVGINNRDLETFTVSLETTERLKAMIPGNVVTISESGIGKREDIVMLADLGVDGALIGEQLVRAEDPTRKIRELLGKEHAGQGNSRSH